MTVTGRAGRLRKALQSVLELWTKRDRKLMTTRAISCGFVVGWACLTQGLAIALQRPDVVWWLSTGVACLAVSLVYLMAEE